MKNTRIKTVIDGDCGSAHLWEGENIIHSGMVIRYSSRKIECFGKSLGGDFLVSSMEEGIQKMSDILIEKSNDLMADAAIKRINDQVNVNVSAAHLKMSLRIAEFRANLFTQFKSIWK